MYQLLSELAISARFSPEMEKLAASVKNSPHKREKYRRVIGHLINRLVKTSRECEAELARLTSSDHIPVRQSDVEVVIDGWQDVEPIEDAEELLIPLKIMHESLIETGFELVADGLLVDIIRRVAVFGMSLVPLDIREESTKHTEALDAITRWLGIGSYREWSEEARINWLTTELGGKRPLFPEKELEHLNFDETVVKTLRTFATAASLNPSALGAYVISQAQTASDVLAVMLLQKQYGMTPDNKNMMRVVPLFETLNDLVNAPDVLETLFTIPLYVGAVKGKQEVMVGYSDSAKDAGRLAACWALYNSQEKMAETAAKHDIELTFFHGKGGSVGRGGNPSVYRAIMAHPPNTINGRFRVTEQGEMIMQNFGTFFTAERTLDTYTAAVCRESFVTHVEPSEEWREEMERLSERSCADYRHLVREEPRFVPYFRQATPELELGALNIGSRPAKRNPKGGVESLRAIPWTFAWTQTRSHLSSWLGVGAALSTTDPAELDTLRHMYKEWPWFRETIDLISMIVSKTDFSISKNYDDQLVDKTGGLIELGEEVRDKLVQTRQALLDVTESKDVAGAHVALQRASSQIRHPYIDPVNVIQAELLKRSRTLEKKGDLSKEELEEQEKLKDALVLSINAIAQGMKNSG
jgi:phosphoenolpyruvate carboxylase